MTDTAQTALREMDVLDAPVGDGLFGDGAIGGVGAPPGRAVFAGWALGSLGASLVFLPFIALFLRFMTDYLAIPAAAAGGILALARFSDAVSDPAVGFLSDRFRSRWGRRRPFLLAGAVVTCLAFVALFQPPALGSPAATLTYVVVVVLIFSVGFTLWYVPYLAMTAELTDEPHARSVLVSYRITGSSLGQLIGGAGGAWLIVAFGGGRHGHAGMATVMGATGGAAMLLCLWLTRGARTNEQVAQARHGTFARVGLLWANKPFVTLASMKLVYFLGNASIAVASAFFTRYVLKVSDNWLGLFLFVGPLAGVASIPVWVRLTKSFEKRDIAMAALAVGVVANLTWLVIPPQAPLPVMFLMYAIIGMMGPGTTMMSFAMLADVMEYDRLLTGLRREGALAGLVTFIEKSSSAGGVALIGLLLGAMGYVQSHGGAGTVQSASAIRGIYIAFAVVPAVGSAISILIISRYRLTRDRLAGLRAASPAPR